MTTASDTLRNQLDTLVQQARAAIDLAATAAEVEQLRVHFLGKKGVLTEQLKQLGSLPPEDRPRVGQWVNDAKNSVSDSLQTRKALLDDTAREARLAREMIDVTLPGRGTRQGGRHPVSRTLERLEELFLRLGIFSASKLWKTISTISRR